DDESDASEGSVDEPVVKKYEVDDDFFQLDAMEKYVNAAEEEEEKDHELRSALKRGRIPADLNEDEEEDDDDDSDEEIDYFQDLNGPIGFGLGDGDEEDPNIMYDEFFGSQRFQHRDRPRHESRKVSFEDDHPDDESESDDHDADNSHPTKPRSLFADDDSNDEEGGREQLSRFEQQQQRLQNRIEQLEAENVGTRDWRMVGEVSARDRPENSLLEQDLEFDHASKPVPVITAEVTESLEDMIKRRILDNQFNDVERKRDPALDQKKPREQVELDHQQSKKSLAEIYEAEYQEQVGEEKGERVLSEREQKLERERQEVL
ncbi:U3 snoRNP protein, partial [Dispira parvispora]